MRIRAMFMKFHRLEAALYHPGGGVQIPQYSGVGCPAPTALCCYKCSDRCFCLAPLPGRHWSATFPDTDPQFKGADSRALARHAACSGARETGLEGNANVDASNRAARRSIDGAVISPPMRERIAADLSSPSIRSTSRPPPPKNLVLRAEER